MTALLGRVLCSICRRQTVNNSDLCPACERAWNKAGLIGESPAKVIRWVAARTRRFAKGNPVFVGTGHFDDDGKLVASWDPKKEALRVRAWKWPGP